MHIKSKGELIKVCREHSNGLKGVFESGGQQISASGQGESDSSAADQMPFTATSTSMEDTGPLAEVEDVFDIEQLLDQEHTTDLVDAHMTPPGSIAKKRTAVAEAAGSLARGMKRRKTSEGGEIQVGGS